ncbi:hypothetical protein M501DRAFT_997018 [Patellaria atrata CBS 101060]|uniref:Origin recognition complex subunit 3 n=1 Tax=Patellaria atrata CBS 101060 TaxID=1346257 RepID=A0A9P4VNH5_9PEZI|nr:hypothetical protein M501DRAFT_997018 [Patellaria atrata CBS 101060]
MDRIPFVLLFGIATSVESFQERLTGATIKRLHGEKFDVIQADELFEQVFKSTIECGDDEWVLRIGSTLAGRLLDRQKDHILSVEAFIDALKYAYMSHFFANPLSILLRTAHLEQQDASKQEEPYFKDIPKDHFEALRNLPSFRRHIEEGAFGEYGDESLLELLDDDSALFTYAQKKMHNAQYQMKEIIRGIDILFAIRSCMPKLPHVPRSALYVKAAAGELRDSPLFRELMLSLRRIPSDVLERVLSTLHKMDFKHEDLSVYMGRLHARLVAMMERSQHPLRSEHNLRNETLRTTVVAQKVELSVQKGALSKEDREYSLLLDDFLDRMKRRIGDVFIDPRNLFLHEVFLYDLKSPHGEVFTPRPRFAIERALSSPHDYLGCSCCAPARGRKGEGDEQALSVTQPPTAILYQLYLESGPLINVSDLWSAFNAIVSSADDDEAFVMAMFQRGLAELKYLGMIKASRKKTDHVAKLAWKGL